MVGCRSAFTGEEGGSDVARFQFQASSYKSDKSYVEAWKLNGHTILQVLPRDPLGDIPKM